MEPRNCHKCGLIINTNSRFCSQCGAEQFKVCPDCTAENDLSSRFCSSCGKELSKKKGKKEPRVSKSSEKIASTKRNMLIAGGAVVIIVASIWYFSIKGIDSTGSRNSSTATAVLDPQIQQTLQMLNSQLEQNPENIQTWIQLGNLYYDAGNFDQAVNYYQHALHMDSTNSNVRVDMGVSYFRIGQSAKAVEEIEKALKFTPGHLNALFNLGVVYNSMGNRSQAEKYWREYISLQPNSELVERIRSIMADWN